MRAAPARTCTSIARRPIGNVDSKFWHQFTISHISSISHWRFICVTEIIDLQPFCLHTALSLFVPHRLTWLDFCAMMAAATSSTTSRTLAAHTMWLCAVPPLISLSLSLSLSLSVYLSVLQRHRKLLSFSPDSLLLRCRPTFSWSYTRSMSIYLVTQRRLWISPSKVHTTDVGGRSMSVFLRYISVKFEIFTLRLPFF